MNTKFKSIVTGAILEPNSEMVAEQLRKNPSFVVYDGQEAAQGDEKPLSKMNKDELLKGRPGSPKSRFLTAPQRRRSSN